jgi:hypothetical protein
MIDTLVAMVFMQILGTDYDFPKNDGNRHFSDDFYRRRLPSRERVHRNWLVFSGVIFCFSCRLYSSETSGKLVLEGSDWNHVGINEMLG